MFFVRVIITVRCLTALLFATLVVVSWVSHGKVWPDNCLAVLHPVPWPSERG